jgi:hypothetical protein
MAVRLSVLPAGHSLHPRAIILLEGVGQLKNPITSLGIEPATFLPEDRNLHYFSYVYENRHDNNE